MLEASTVEQYRGGHRGGAGSLARFGGIDETWWFTTPGPWAAETLRLKEVAGRFS